MNDAVLSESEQRNILLYFAEALEMKFELTSDISDLELSIVMQERALELTLPRAPIRTEILIGLCASLRLLSEMTSNVQTLERAIAFGQLGLQSSDLPPLLRASLLHYLGLALLRQFECKGSSNDLTLAISSEEEALGLVSIDEPFYRTVLCNLGLMLQRRFETSAMEDDLNRAIVLNERALGLTAPGTLERLGPLAYLSNGLHLRFSRTGFLDDLDRGIEMKKECLTLVTNQTDQATTLHGLCHAYKDRFSRTGSLEDLERSVQVGKLALQLLPTGHSLSPGLLRTLGNSLYDRFRRTGSKRDLDESISVTERALSATSGTRYNHAEYLDSLAVKLLSRFEQTQSSDDLNRAIELTSDALSLTPVDNASRPDYLHSLANSLRIRFDKLGSVQDLGLAFEHCKEAEALTSSGHPLRRSILNIFAIILRNKSERSTSIEDLSQAIAMHKNTLELTPNGHPARFGYVINFCVALRARFARTGSIDDLDDAIAMLRELLKTMPSDHPDRALCNHNLAAALTGRFVQLGSMDDLDFSVASYELSIKGMQKEHASYTKYINGLSTALGMRFARTGSIDDFSRQVSLLEEAISSTGGGATFPTLINNLGEAFRKTYEKTRSPTDLDNAILKFEQALVESTEPDLRMISLSNLGYALQQRFENTNSLDDIDRAILINRQAVEITPDDHPFLAFQLANLGNALRLRFRILKTKEDLEQAIYMNEIAVSITTAMATHRIRAAQDAAALLTSTSCEDRHRAANLLMTAVELLPQVSPRSLKQSDQLSMISEFFGLTAEAVSLSLDCGKSVPDALRMLELGRGVLASLLLEVRSDVSLLQTECPQLAAEFINVRRDLEIAQAVEFPSTQNTCFDPERSRLLSKRLDKLLAQIREIDGFKHFLLGPAEEDLNIVAKYGPIVVFNVSRFRSDAFLVTEEKISLIELPSLTLQELESQVELFLSVVHDHRVRNYSKRKEQVKRVLEWLWDVAAEPILNALGLKEPCPDGSRPPRVWWVGSGLLNVLPIHAAGYHDKGSGRSVIDRVISSYSQSLKTLIYARQRGNRNAKKAGERRCLIVGMPTTPGKEDLPFVKVEIEELRKLLPTLVATTIISDPTREKVLSALVKHGIVHFACHGYSSPSDPSQSMFLLTDWATAPLTVSDLTSLNLDSAQLAILTACHTAITRDHRLLDESIHLSAALQLAGYPSVVGSLWQISDEHSAHITRDIRKIPTLTRLTSFGSFPDHPPTFLTKRVS